MLRSLKQTPLLIAVFLFPANHVLFAQTQRGEIVGRVTDGSGAVVPGAQVNVVSIATAIASHAQTNAEGLYTVPSLPYGTYQVTVSATGFAPFVAESVLVATATTTTLNAALQLAGTGQQVTVNAQSAILESSTSSVDTSFESKLLGEIPNLMNGQRRSAVSFVNLSPGYNSVSGDVAGGRDHADEALLDGETISVRSRFSDFRPLTPPSYNLPSVEAIGEYAMLTNGMPAEYGRTSGGMTTFSTKSGGDSYHGVLFEYFRNQDLDARPWQATTLPSEKQNEFGFALGGPVWIPKVYNGKNKTFFWTTLSGYKLRQDAVTQVLTVPTAAMRSGDFSASDISPIYNSSNLTTNSQGNVQRVQFPGNVIPENLISPVSQYFLQYVPLPNLPGSNNNYVGAAPTVKNDWDFSVKIDHYFNAANRVSLFYQWAKPDTYNSNIMGALFGSIFIQRLNRTRLDWTYTISPTLVNDATYGFNRYTTDSARNNYGQGLGLKAGIRGTYDPNCPEINLGGNANFNICNDGQTSDPADTKAALFSTFNDTLLKNSGAHTVKVGINLIRFNENFETRGGSGGSAAGDYSFDNGATANTNSSGGNVWASYLLGLPTSVTMQAPTILGLRQTYFAAFVQDDWKVNSKLTVNAGLRWDLNVPYDEVNGQTASVNVNLPNPGAGNIPGAMVFYGSGPGRLGYNRPGKIHWKDFAPRLGFAYQINSKTVFRAFAGIIYQGAQTGNAENENTSGFIGGGSPTPNPNTFGPYYNWDTPYPQSVLGTIPNTNPAFRNGQSVSFANENGLGIASPIYEWSASIQRQLKWGLVLELTYFANDIRHGVDKLPLDELNPVYWPLGSLLTQPLSSPQVQAMGFKAPYAGFSMSQPLYQALLPYPQYTGLTDTATPWTSSTYNAGIAKIQKRFSSGLSLMANYTWSKRLTDLTGESPNAVPLDAYNYSLSKGLDRQDVPERVVISYSYELPVGPGRKFLSHAGGVGGFLLGGWTFSGIQTYQDGFPALVVGGLGTTIPTVSVQANRVAGVPLRSSLSCSAMQFGNPLKDHLFNAGNPAEAAATGLPLAFSSEGNYGFGNAPIVDPHARQCGTEDEDLTLDKVMLVHEKIGIRFGVETYNVFNRHSWETVANASTQNINSSTFGVIQPYQVNGPREFQVKLRVEF